MSKGAKSLQDSTTARIHAVSRAGGEGVDPDRGSGSNRSKGAELSAFFERLRLALEHRGRTQADLARDLGVGTATVSEWFTRGRVPSGDVMLRLPHSLGISGHWLLTGAGAMELAWNAEDDPYLHGVRDTLERLEKCLPDVGRQLGLPHLSLDPRD